MAPNLEKEADHLKDRAKKSFLDILENVRGKKNIVFSKDLTGRFGLFGGASTLKDYGIDKIFVLENDNTDSTQRNIVYVVDGEKADLVQAAGDQSPRSSGELVHTLTLTTAQIQRLQKSGVIEHDFFVIWVPRRTLVSNKILEDQGVLGDVTVFELPLLFLPLEQDLFSLELNDCFNELYLKHDPTSIYLASKALMQIQQRHGLFPRILGKGDNARRLANLLLRGRKELDADEASTQYTTIPSTTIDSLIIIDRDVDFASVFLTQLTYEGLIDELIGVKHNKADIDTSIIGAASLPKQAQSSSVSQVQPLTATQGMKRTIQLDSSDPLFQQLRSANFALIGPMLNKIARQLQSDYEVRHQAQGIHELREFVNKLPAFQQEHQSLGVHTNLADYIIKHTKTETFNRDLEVQQNVAAGTDPIYQHETIEELIARDTSLSTVLRLLCLESTVAGGLRPKDLDNFKRLVVQAYGYQHVLTLDRLEKMELLQSRSSAGALLLPVGGVNNSVTGTKTNYAYMRKELKLIIDEYNEQDPEDIAYVYSGYAPLSVRMVQCILQKQYIQSLHKSPLAITSSSTGWTGFEDFLKSAKGPTFNLAQKASDEKASKAKMALTSTASWKTVFVMFLGGITFAEVAALRYVSKKLSESGQRKRIVVCTTAVISGRSVMERVIEVSNLGTGTR